MMNLVKEKATDKYIGISDLELTTNQSLYIDRSNDPIYWYNHHLEAGFSYWQSRYAIKTIVEANALNVDGFQDPIKEIFSIYDLGDKNMIYAYLSGLGMTPQQIDGVMLYRASVNVSKLGKDAQDIIQSPKIIQIGVKFLTLIDAQGRRDNSQATAFTTAIQSFLTEYTRWGTLGLNYGSMEEAVMDYIESTGAYALGGLLTYTINPAMVIAYGNETNARNAMIVELQDVFVKGNI